MNGSAARSVEPAGYAMSGVVPRAASRPADRDELIEMVRAAARDGLRIVPWGGGTALARQPAPDHYDLALDLTGLDRMVEYDPEDLTLAAECGIRMADLRSRVAARRQELPLECAHAERATLGGALSANASGARRLRFGGPRDRILGAWYVLGDGTLVRTGGRVVKNVAGYGIHRLLCGSRGGLAILVEASLKLMPEPAARVAMIYEMNAEQIADRARWAPFPRTEPAVFSVVAAGDRRGGASAPPLIPGTSGRAPFWVVLGYEEDPPRIEQLVARTEDSLGAPAARVDGAGAAALWQALADWEDRAAPRLTFTSPHNTPAALAPLLAEAVQGAAVFHSPCGRLHMFPLPGQAIGWIERLAEREFALIEARGIEAAPATPPLAATGALRRRIRAALDPDSRFALGGNWERSWG